MQIFSSASCLEAEGSGDISDICLLSRLESEPRKQKQLFHASETLLQRIKRCCFSFCGKEWGPLSPNKTPLKTRREGTKLVFHFYYYYFLLFPECTERRPRVSGTHDERSDTAESIGWPAQAAYLAAFVCSATKTVWLSEIMRRTVDGSHACQCQQKLSTSFLAPLTINYPVLDLEVQPRAKTKSFWFVSNM